MSETNMSDFESQFTEQPDVEKLVASFVSVEGKGPNEIIEGMEAMEFSAGIITEIARSLQGNPRCIAEQDHLMLRLDTFFESDAKALEQPSLPGVSELIAVTGPVSSSDQSEFWHKAGVQITDSDGTKTVYQFERQKAPMIRILAFDPNVQMHYDVPPRPLIQSDRIRLSDAVKALDSSQT